MDRGVGNPEQCGPSSSQAGEKPTGHQGLESNSSVSTSIGSSDYRSQVALRQTVQTRTSLENPNPMRQRASNSKQNAGNSKNKNKIKNKKGVNSEKKEKNKIKNSVNNEKKEKNMKIKNKKSVNSEKNMSRRTGEVCSCAASFTADCAAICCCPCAILQLLVLAFVRVPSSFVRKALCSVRKKAALRRSSNRKRPADHKDDHDDGENERGPYALSPLCYTDSPATTDGTSPPAPKLDTQKLWMELYEAGCIGFAGPPLH